MLLRRPHCRPPRTRGTSRPVLKRRRRPMPARRCPRVAAQSRFRCALQQPRGGSRPRAPQHCSRFGPCCFDRCRRVGLASLFDSQLVARRRRLGLVDSSRGCLVACRRCLGLADWFDGHCCFDRRRRFRLANLFNHYCLVAWPMRFRRHSSLLNGLIAHGDTRRLVVAAAVAFAGSLTASTLGASPALEQTWRQPSTRRAAAASAPRSPWRHCWCLEAAGARASPCRMLYNRIDCPCQLGWSSSSALSAVRTLWP